VNEIWNKGVPDESDIALLGIAFHRCKHVYIQLLVEYGVEADSELAQQAFTKGVALAQTPSWLLPELRQLWERHAEHYELNLSGYVTAEERESSGGVAFTPDLVTANTRINELEIHDDKSGWAPPPSEDELKMLYQARAYCCFARDRWPGFSSYRFSLHAVRYNVMTSVVFTDAELDEIEREVRADIATLEHAKRTDSWPAVPGPSCRFCSLQCPVLDNTPAIMPKRLTEVESAQKLAAWTLAGQNMVKQAKKVLKEYCSAHGPISVNGVEWNNRPGLERKYSLTVVLEVLKLNDIAGVFENSKQDQLTVSHSALKKLFALHPRLEEDLAKHVQSKTKYKFSAKQAADPDREAAEEGDDE
jgi:hypothetical protein